MSSLRVVLDTNVLASGIAYPLGTPGRILTAWRSGGLNVVLSRYILDELARVLPRLGRISLSEAESRDVADSLMFLAEIVEPDSLPSETVRDAADTPILGTLLAAKADYLVTGDKDLLVLGEKYPILTPSAFWARHGS
jgi:uncharacterized protein